MVKPTPGSAERAAAQAAGELALMQAQTREARAELARLQQEIADAERHLGSTQTAQLLEANEQLALAALRAQSEADTATQALDEASRSAERDALTGLPTRALLLDRFTQAIAIAKRRQSRLALLFLDLNKFKQINDTLGHGVGDEVLKIAARCFTSSVREADTVCRWGGDEFVILLTEVSQPSDAGVIALKVIAALGVPSRVGDHVLRLSTSIGIGIYPDDGDDAQTLIERADAAMYRAKRHGVASFAFHGHEPTDELTPPRAPDALRQPLTRYDEALAEKDRRHASLREVNERLVLAALSAEEKRAAAEHAQRRQAEFLAVVAQEFRNPLAPIRTAAATLGRLKSEEPLLPRVQAIIERQVAHMSRLIDDLLDLSRIGTEAPKLDRRPVDIGAIVEAAVAACRPALDARLQRLEVDLPARAPKVDADPLRLEQILGNLLDNASQHTPDYGRIELSVVVAGNALVMTVSDNGEGIASDALPTLFEPFVRDRNPAGSNGTGLGLGLTVVRALVNAHGGTVVASSAGPGLGSRFVVTLPLA